MKRMVQGLLLAGSLALGGAALAQDTARQQPRDAQARGEVKLKGGMVEHRGFSVPAEEKAFLERLHHINQEEIQLGKLAQQNAQSPEVKAYGEMMVKDHSAADARLMEHAKKKGLKLSERPRPMNELERKSMAAQKADMEMLQTLQGAAFDAYFLSDMVANHDMALGKLMAARQHFTDTELSSLVQQHAQAFTQHRQQAHTLLGQIGPGAQMGVGGAGELDETQDEGQVAPQEEGMNHMHPGDMEALDPGSQKRP